jgi:hypothetical protein
MVQFATLPLDVITQLIEKDIEIHTNCLFVGDREAAKAYNIDFLKTI